MLIVFQISVEFLIYVDEHLALSSHPRAGLPLGNGARRRCFLDDVRRGDSSITTSGRAVTAMETAPSPRVGGQRRRRRQQERPTTATTSFRCGDGDIRSSGLSLGTTMTSFRRGDDDSRSGEPDLVRRGRSSLNDFLFLKINLWCQHIMSADKKMHLQSIKKYIFDVCR
jgi:hypothetical protein